jgi:epoxyqueuosine reductase QueG
MVEMSENTHDKMQTGNNKLHSVVDMHVHSGTNWVDRLLTDEEAVEDALSSRMGGGLLKSHSHCTLSSCLKIKKHLGLSNTVFASLVLNFEEQLRDINGMCDKIKKGVRMIYMPTIMSTNDTHFFKRGYKKLSILSNGVLCRSVQKILEVALRYNCTIATGHIGRLERDALLSFCENIGIRTVVVSHPEYFVTEMSLEEQKKIADRWPNTLFERTLYSILDEHQAQLEPGTFPIVPRQLAKLVAAIKQIGPERTVISSDLGQVFNLRPVQGLTRFIKILLGNGLSKEDISIMTKLNPMRCLGLFNEMVEIVTHISYRKNTHRFKTRFDTLLVGFAKASDPIFKQFKEVVGRDHFLPCDLLANSLSVISIYLPFGRDIIASNEKGKSPSPEWCLAYTEANTLLNILTSSVKNAIEKSGFACALSSAFHHLSNCHDRDVNEKLLSSRWSQRHIGYACGLGTFGRNNLLITEKGSAGRFSSLVAEIPLIPKNRPKQQFCLSKSGNSCDICIDRCPSKALSRTGFDRLKCWQYLIGNNHVSKKHNPQIVNVCGKCCTGTPCAKGMILTEKR